MAAETIKEFLVSLGYSVDNQSEQKFKNSMRGAVVQANLMSEALIGTAKAVFEAVAKISQSFDSLYWTSQRTGDSVENIRALSYAVSQLGGTYEGARTAIEAFGQHLRSNPGYASMLRAMGIRTDENGKMRDQVLILQDLGKTLSKMPYYQALQYAGALGIDENTMRALMSGDLVKQMQKYRDIQKGVGLDSDKAAESSRKLMAALAETQAHIEAVATKILTDLQPQITDMLKAISDWFVAHKDDIKQILTDLIGAVTDLVKGFKDLVDELDPVWKGFQKIAESVTGKDGLKAAFEAFAIYVTGAWILGILGAFGKFKLGWALLLGGGAWLYNNSSIEQGAERGERWNKAIEGTSAFKWYDGIKKKVRGWFGLDSGGPEGGIDTSKNAIQLAGESYRYYRQAGFTHAQAAGLVANEAAESGFNFHAKGDWDPQLGKYTAGGGMQWHKRRRDQILAGTGIDVWSKDISHLDMLKAVVWELQNTEKEAHQALLNANDPYEAGSAVSQTYERPRDKYGEADRRGKLAQKYALKFSHPDFIVGPTLPPGGVQNSATMNQATNITVNGATDPSTTAQMIQDKQNGVNSVLLRNMQGWAR